MNAGIALVLVVLAVGLGRSARAQVSDSPLASRDGATLSPKAEIGIKDSGLTFHGEVGSETIQYPTNIDGRPDLSQNNRVEVDLALEYQSSRSLSRAQFQASKSLNLNEQSFAIQELYSGAANGRGFFFGRRLEFWNQADQDWNLGLWQPLFQGDSLRPLQQGLTGLFYVHEADGFEFVGFVSPIFIPTMGSEIKEQSGALVSDSRWVRPFPSSVNINNAPTTLTYRLEIPATRELVLQPAVGARLRFGPRDQGLWGALAYANKPINSLSIKYDAALVSGAGGVTGQANVSPIVHRHHILSADLGYRDGRTQYGLSVLVDAPLALSVKNSTNSAGFVTDYFQQQPKPIQLISAKVSTATALPFIERELNWTATYLVGKNEPTADYDASGVERSQMVPYRLLFTNAVSLQGQLEFSPQWQSRVRYLRDFDQRGSMWNVEGQYKPNTEWAFRLGFDVLGVDDQRAQESDTRFLNYYRQNDRVYGGFDYVF